MKLTVEITAFSNFIFRNFRKNLNYLKKKNFFENRVLNRVCGSIQYI